MPDIPKCIFFDCESNGPWPPNHTLTFYILATVKSSTATSKVLNEEGSYSFYICERHYLEYGENTPDCRSIAAALNHHEGGSFVGVECSTSHTPSTSMHNQHTKPEDKQKFLVTPLETREITFRIPPSNKPRLMILSNAYAGIHAKLIPEPDTKTTSSKPVNPMHSLPETVKPSEVRRVPIKTNIVYSTKDRLQNTSPRVVSGNIQSSENSLPRVTNQSQPAGVQGNSNADNRRFERIPTNPRKTDPRPVGNTNLSQRVAGIENKSALSSSTGASASEQRDNRKAVTNTKLTQPITDHRPFFDPLSEPDLKAARPTVANTNTTQQVVATDLDRVFNTREAVVKNKSVLSSGTGATASEQKDKLKTATDTKLTRPIVDNRQFFNPLSEPDLKAVRPKVASTNTTQQVAAIDHDCVFYATEAVVKNKSVLNSGTGENASELKDKRKTATDKILTQPIVDNRQFSNTLSELDLKAARPTVANTNTTQQIAATGHDRAFYATEAVVKNKSVLNSGTGAPASVQKDKRKTSTDTKLTQPIVDNLTLFSPLLEPDFKAVRPIVANTNTTQQVAVTDHDRVFYDTVPVVENEFVLDSGTCTTVSQHRDNGKAASDTKLTQPIVDNPLFFNPLLEPDLKAARPTVANTNTTQHVAVTDHDRAFYATEDRAPAPRYNTDFSMLRILNTPDTVVIESGYDSNQEDDGGVTNEGIIKFSDPWFLRTNLPPTSTEHFIHCHTHEPSEFVQMIKNYAGTGSTDSAHLAISNNGFVRRRLFLDELEIDKKRARKEEDDNYDETDTENVVTTKPFFTSKRCYYKDSDPGSSVHTDYESSSPTPPSSSA